VPLSDGAGVPGSVVIGSVGAAVGDGASVEGATVGGSVTSTTPAWWTVTSTTAASCDDDTAGGVGAGGSVMVGCSTPITIVLPSDRTVSWTVGVLEGPGAPVGGIGAFGSCCAVGAAEFWLWDVAETTTAASA
jgi:hypothetical protein